MYHNYGTSSQMQHEYTCLLEGIVVLVLVCLSETMPTVQYTYCLGKRKVICYLSEETRPLFKVKYT